MEARIKHPAATCMIVWHPLSLYLCGIGFSGSEILAKLARSFDFLPSSRFIQHGPLVLFLFPTGHLARRLTGWARYSPTDGMGAARSGD